MIRVDHVDVAHVRGRRLIGEIDGMPERDVPNRKRFKFCVSGADAAFVLMIKLRKTGRHFSAAGAGRGDDDKLARGFDVIVFAEALVAYDERDIRRIILNRIMPVYPNAKCFQPFLELLCRGLRTVMGDDDAADKQPDAAEGVDQTQRIEIIGDAEVAAPFVLFDVVRRYDDDDFGTVAQLIQHFDFAVRLEAGKHAGGVIIVKKLASEFEVQLASEGIDSLEDFF